VDLGDDRPAARTARREGEIEHPTHAGSNHTSDHLLLVA
jgi:hypothetical protein